MTNASVPIEEVRKRARILVIDDQEWPAQAMFERDGYHIERWAEIKNLSQLTDGHFHVILLDVNGVGLKEDPKLQGLGILSAIKTSNIAQPVVLYSAAKQGLSSSAYIQLADAVLDKKSSYIDFKHEVDGLLLRTATPAYFVAQMNRVLGEQALLAPNAVAKALKAFKRGRTDGLERYLNGKLSEPAIASAALQVVSVGIEVVGLLNGG